MTSGSGVERRHFVRIDEEDVLICEPFDNFAGRTKNERFHAFTKSLSEGGILFDTDRFFDVGAVLKLEIDIPGWEKYKNEFYKADSPAGRQPLVVLGRVVRVEDVGGSRFDIGVAFIAVDKEHRQALHKYVEKKSAQKVTRRGE